MVSMTYSKEICVKETKILVKLKLESYIENRISFTRNGLYETVSKLLSSGIIFILCGRLFRIYTIKY